MKTPRRPVERIDRKGNSFWGVDICDLPFGFVLARRATAEELTFWKRSAMVAAAPGVET